MSEVEVHTIKVIVDVFDGVEYGTFSVPVPNAIMAIQKVWETVPTAHQRDAVFCIETTSGYDGDCEVSCYIQYDRPETDGERRAREQKQARNMSEHEARERRELARLKDKYGE
jgi:hypothetical protein